MQIEITHKFQKQLLKCPDNKIRLNVLKIIKEVQNTQKIADIKNIRKLSGFRHYYRSRTGSYRIGLKFENNTVIFSAFDHRSDIYKYFP